MTTALLEIRDLSIQFNTVNGVVYAVNHVDLKLAAGEVLGIVGESGSGKSQMMLSLSRLLPENATISGQVIYNGENIYALQDKQVNQLRNRDIAIVFQDPMTCLNPYLTIATQLIEGLVVGQGIAKAEAMLQATAMLEKVRIADAQHCMQMYPHQLSGGMRQRVMIAMALLRRPKILIADEPTTALDVTVQAEILRLLKSLTDEFELSVLFVTHDLSVVAGQCDRIAVMYAGRVVELAQVEQLFNQPRHPYTRGLLASARSQSGLSDELVSIAGQPPQNNEPVSGCAFAPRCHDKLAVCERLVPQLDGDERQQQACHLYD